MKPQKYNLDEIILRVAKWTAFIIAGILIVSLFLGLLLSAGDAEGAVPAFKSHSPASGAISTPCVQTYWVISRPDSANMDNYTVWLDGEVVIDSGEVDTAGWTVTDTDWYDTLYVKRDSVCLTRNDTVWMKVTLDYDTSGSLDWVSYADSFYFVTHGESPVFRSHVPDSAETSVDPSTTIDWSILRPDSNLTSNYTVLVAGNVVVDSGTTDTGNWTVTNENGSGCGSRCKDTLTIVKRGATHPLASRIWVVCTMTYDTNGSLYSGGSAAFADSFWFDTDYDSIMYVYSWPMKHVGESPSPTIMITGMRSVGMSIFSSESTSPIVSPTSSESNPDSITNWYPTWSWSWTLDNSYGVMDACSIWGMNHDSVYTDTIPVYRSYTYLKHGTFRDR